mmetsp:Transcript_44527/g.82863  ORF Transcript_44527/g.82863 Transcript_44527/m.82863 type:complete len:754 (-) Transcript_44527:79-2340(-)
MRKSPAVVLLCGVLHITGPTLAAGVSTETPEELVQLLAGTDTLGGFAPSTGNTLPQIKTPWGFNDWVPSTNHNGDAWFFRRSDGIFRGMRCTHQPSPWIGDYGHFLLQPHVKDKPHDFIWSPASDETVFRPYMFKATFERIQFAFVPTSHAGILRMIFPSDADAAHLSLSIEDGDLSVNEADKTIRGRSTSNAGGVPPHWEGMYFTLQAFSGIRAVRHDKETHGEHQHQRGTFLFERNDDPILVAVGTSFISQEQADLNLRQEVGSKSFKEVLKESRREWSQQLGRIRAEAVDDDQLAVFYTNLWKSMLFPRYLQELDATGKVVHRSPYTGQVKEGNLVTDSGFWDSYLTVYHLQSVVFPENLGKTIDGWVKSYEEADWLPQWASPGEHASMVGTMGDVVLADAIAKSRWGVLSGFDVDKAYDAIRKDAFTASDGVFGREGMEEYLRFGYVPSYVEMSVSRTLDYYVSDAAISRAAEILGKQDDAQTLYKRSKQYGVIFNKNSGFFEPKDMSGSFIQGYNPRSWGSGFTEAGAWQYRFFLPHDVDGLQKLHDGRLCDAIQDMLSHTEGKIFEGGYNEEYHEIAEGNKIHADFGLYAHNNQPVHQVLYVAKKAGCNTVADSSLRKVMSLLYTKSGWSGDEDNGEMASWYVLSALGIFALEGAKDEIILGSPALSSATVQLPKGRLLTITAVNQDEGNVFVHSVTWTPEDGSPRKIRDNVMKYTELMRGGTLKFVMSAHPKHEKHLRGTKRHVEY